MPSLNTDRHMQHKNQSTNQTFLANVLCRVALSTTFFSTANPFRFRTESINLFARFGAPTPWPSSPNSSLSSSVCGTKKGSTSKRSQCDNINDAAAAPDDRRLNSSANPKDASAGKYAWMVNTSDPSRISSRSTRALRRPSTAYTADRPSEEVATSHRKAASTRRGPLSNTAFRSAALVALVT